MVDIWMKTLAASARTKLMATDDFLARLKAEETATREARSARDYWQEQANKRSEQVRRLLVQLMGGNTNPKETPSHPGQILLSFGWEYVSPDNTETDFNLDDEAEGYGCYWLDPETKGTGKLEWHSLPGALNVAFRRLLGWSLESGPESAPERPSRYKRMLQDDDEG